MADRALPISRAMIDRARTINRENKRSSRVQDGHAECLGAAMNMATRTLFALGLALTTSTFSKSSMADDSATTANVFDDAFSRSPAERAVGFSIGLTKIVIGDGAEIGLFFRGALLTANRGISKDMLARQPVWVERIAPRCLPLRIPLFSATF